MSFKQEIEKLIESNLKTYQDNSDRFIADYNRELELTKEYNGRQLLELLQNADDAGSTKVLINWDKECNKLCISNQGEPFEIGGIKSLMLANLSTKTKISYIGNKGLGFRSILNWSEQIIIYTNGCKISFSEKIAADVFNNKLKLSAEAKQKIRWDRNLSNQTIPFPILAIPAIEENGTSLNWTTTIEITYRQEFEADIEIQLSEIREEILLFLNNIQKITIKKDTEILELDSAKEPFEDFEIISIKDKKWKVFSRERILPNEYQDKSKNEKQSYNLKVAFQDDLSDNYKKLFNFFPTRLSIALPCIIHGTFELNSSRNHLNESKRNDYILKELVQLLKECALYLTEQKTDWRPYKIISPSITASDSKLIDAFYKELEVLKQTEKIYPCINNEHYPLENTFYYNDEFNGFFQKHFSEILPELLIPLNNEVVNNFKNNTFKHDFLVEKIDALSETKLTIPLRAELITQLAKIIAFNDEKKRFSLLVNETDKLISKEDLAFTPVVRSEESFNIPKSVKVDFMKSELYDLLISKFESDFDKKEPKSRELQRSIKSVVNLQPYDSNNVIDKIIAGTKDALKYFTVIDDQNNCIKEMVTALYVNFKNIENRLEKLKIAVPLVSKTNAICDAKDLYLSRTYPSGELTETIYDRILKTNDYLESIEYWTLENEEKNLVESFFLWLGVNRYSKTELKTITDRWEENEYFDFIFNNGLDKPDDFDRGSLSKSNQILKIKDFELIARLPINHLILLVIKDEQIRQRLETNSEKMDWFFTRWRPTIIPDYSYIRYQFIEAGFFTKYILEEGGEDLNKLINEDFQIDYDFLSGYGINKTDVKSILIKMGAKESFNDISPENIYEILKAIPEKDVLRKGDLTQRIYKLSLDSLVKHKSKAQIPTDLKFFSKNGELGDYKYQHEIFYLNNNLLPKKILDSYFLINLPKRSSEENVKKYFNVSSLSEYKVTVKEDILEPNNNANNSFNKLFEIIKPYILAYRLNSPNLRRGINEEGRSRQDEAKALKDCKITIVNSCIFDFHNYQNIEIGEKEYINDKNSFYYRDSMAVSFEDLKKDSIFCDAFSEMMTILFKVNDLKNDFRQILKNDIQDTIHLANQDLDKEKIEEAFQLLGVSRLEIDFWKNVFTLKGKQLIEPIETTEILKKRVIESLGISIPDGYTNIDFEYFGNKASYELICLLCNDLSFAVNNIVPTGLYNWHHKGFIACIKDNEYKFKQLVWLALTNKKEEQGKFISILNDYCSNFINLIEGEIYFHKFDLEVDYLEIIKQQIKNHFKIDLDSLIKDDLSIQNLYNELLEKYNIEEVDISDETNRSLLFFKGNDETINKYLIEQFGEKQEETSSENKNTKIIGNLIEASLSKNCKPIQVASDTGNGTWVHSGHGDKAKKQKGKRAELLVYNTLINEYGIENVKWVSGNSTTPDKNDKLHYDIEYKNESGEWKYLEVKAMSDNQFIISGPEKEKGVSEPDKFEMALVNDTSIYMVKDIFKFKQGETFEINSKFVAFPKDYIFVFNINSAIN